MGKISRSQPSQGEQAVEECSGRGLPTAGRYRASSSFRNGKNHIPQLTWFFILKGAIQLMVQPQVMMSWNGGYWPLFGLDAQPEQDLGGKRPVQASRAIILFLFFLMYIFFKFQYC